MTVYREDEIERILAAVATIEESIGVLAEHARRDRDAFHEDRAARDIVERRFVKTTEASLDIARTLVTSHGREIPESNPGLMRALAEIGILDPELAEEMAKAARFRNVLAHTYGDVIDHDVVYEALQDLDRYRSFLVAVRDHLDDAGALDP